MRIVGGYLGGRRFDPPAGPHLRPTTDRAREALFNILANHTVWPDTPVLDLFAGGGGVSLECISRGAPRVVAVEKDGKTVRYLQRLALSWAVSTLEVVHSPAERYLTGPAEPFGLVFLDPPYAYPGKAALVEQVRSQGWVAPGGWVVLEHATGETFADAPGFDQARVYGQSAFAFFQAPGL